MVSLISLSIFESLCCVVVLHCVFVAASSVCLPVRLQVCLLRLPRLADDDSKKADRLPVCSLRRFGIFTPCDIYGIGGVGVAGGL
jgi:hypothetical protein